MNSDKKVEIRPTYIGNTTPEELVEDEVKTVLILDPTLDREFETESTLKEIDKIIGAGFAGKWYVDISKILYGPRKIIIPETACFEINQSVLEEVCHSFSETCHENDAEESAWRLKLYDLAITYTADPFPFVWD